MNSDAIRIVMVHTSHSGNIGAAARAMKNMGLGALHLVRPYHFPSAEAVARASGADDVLAAARVHDTLEEALTGCHLAIATSARSRRIDWPQWSARQAAEQAVVLGQQAPVAFVFGRERSGLTNAELDLCQAMVSLPAHPDYTSLNVAAAIQVLAYEVRLAGLALEAEPLQSGERSASVSRDDMESYYQHLEQALIESGFLDPASPKHLMRRLRRLYDRAAPDPRELNILRGILTEFQKHGRRN